MKRLKITIPARLRPHLKKLVKRGLNGNTERAVVIRFVEEKIRESIR